jgi:hypothetical protein
LLVPGDARRPPVTAFLIKSFDIAIVAMIFTVLS